MKAWRTAYDHLKNDVGIPMDEPTKRKKEECIMKRKGQATHAGNNMAQLLIPGEAPFPVEIADTFLKRFLGLMGRHEGGYGLFLEPCDSIHMMFMRFPIDTIFVDREGVIVSMVKGLKPWRFAMGGKKAFAVLELPSTKGLSEKLEIGMILPMKKPAD